MRNMSKKVIMIAGFGQEQYADHNHVDQYVDHVDHVDHIDYIDHDYDSCGTGNFVTRRDYSCHQNRRS